MWCSDACRRQASDARRAVRLGIADFDRQRLLSGERSKVIEAVASDPALLADAIERATRNLFQFSRSKLERVLTAVMVLEGLAGPALKRWDLDHPARHPVTPRPSKPKKPRVPEPLRAVLDSVTWRRSSVEAAETELEALGLDPDTELDVGDELVERFLQLREKEIQRRVKAQGISEEMAEWMLDRED